MKFWALSLACGIFLSGCTSVSTTSRPADYYRHQSADYSNTTETGNSLFDEDKIAFNYKDIEKILTHQISFPAINRIAIVNLAPNNYWRFYSSDFTLLTDETVNGFVEKLKASNRIYDASFMPSLLIPETRTVPYLRQAAVRYQADMLLVYKTHCQSFKKHQFIDPDQSRAYCSIESVLIDTRTGIVPFTSISTQTFTAEKQQQDVSFSETIRKAELKAIGNGLQKVATDLRAFIEASPTL